MKPRRKTESFPGASVKQGGADFLNRRTQESPFSSCNAEFFPQSLMGTGFAYLLLFKLAGAKLWGFRMKDRTFAIFELQRRIFLAKPYGVWLCSIALFSK
jgi:hypothetical protein